MIRLSIAVLLASVAMAGAGMRETLLVRHARAGAAGAATNTWDDYAHYWHPGKYTNGLDYGNAATKLNATNIIGSVPISDRGWAFATSRTNYITLSAPISNAPEWSIAFWFASGVGGSVGGWVLDDSGGSTTRDMQASISSAGEISSGAWNTSGTANFLLEVSPPSTNWTHVAFAWGASNGTTYVDGEAVTNSAYAGTLRNASTTTRIGNRVWGTPTANYGYSGNLDKLQFWNRKLTATEAAALAAQARGDR